MPIIRDDIIYVMYVTSFIHMEHRESVSCRIESNRIESKLNFAGFCAPFPEGVYGWIFFVECGGYGYYVYGCYIYIYL